jgi:hypothetical protein
MVFQLCYVQDSYHVPILELSYIYPYICSRIYLVADSLGVEINSDCA